MRHTRGFTLIELLVVITIIVVLLALLTPALDKAIYSAEMASCAAKLDSLAVTVTAYAAEQRRYYPDRTAAGWAQQVCSGQYGDDRPLLSKYLSINKHLLDPLSDAVDLENDQQDVGGRREITFASYAMWFDFNYQVDSVSPLQGIRKLGDHMLYGEDRISVLLQDSDVTHTSRPDLGFTSHPDDPQVQVPWKLQHELQPGGAAVLTQGYAYSFSFWRSPGPARGTVDNNYAYVDGSVRRIDQVQFVYGNDVAGAAEQDMTLLPIDYLGKQQRRVQVPVR